MYFNLFSTIFSHSIYLFKKINRKTIDSSFNEIHFLFFSKRRRHPAPQSTKTLLTNQISSSNKRNFSKKEINKKVQNKSCYFIGYDAALTEFLKVSKQCKKIFLS